MRPPGEWTKEGEEKTIVYRYYFGQLYNSKTMEDYLCHCGNEPEELHVCPFKSEIHDNYELCNCCKDCEYECCQDI